MNVNAKDEYGWTAVHFAIDKNRLDVVRFSTQDGLADVEEADNAGCTALHFACRFGDHLNVVIWI